MHYDVTQSLLVRSTSKINETILSRKLAIPYFNLQLIATVPEGTVASQSLSQIVPQTVPDSAEVGSMDTECTAIGLER